MNKFNTRIKKVFFSVLLKKYCGPSKTQKPTTPFSDLLRSPTTLPRKPHYVNMEYLSNILDYESCLSTFQRFKIEHHVVSAFCKIKLDLSKEKAVS
ncbi:hypothetical protein CapIbe_009156 [Capra ibex]